MEPMTSFKVSLKLLSFVLLCTLLLPTCAYDSDDDNFVDVPKPSEQFQIGIDLAGVDPDQVIIYIHPDTSIIRWIPGERKS